VPKDAADSSRPAGSPPLYRPQSGMLIEPPVGGALEGPIPSQ